MFLKVKKLAQFAIVSILTIITAIVVWNTLHIPQMISEGIGIAITIVITLPRMIITGVFITAFIITLYEWWPKPEKNKIPGMKEFVQLGIAIFFLLFGLAVLPYLMP